MKRLTRKVPRSKRKHKGTIEGFALMLRNNMTKAEELFWKHLKKRQRAWKHTFLPQVVVHGYVPDFYCETLNLAVEIDGRVHDRKDVRRNDKIRTRRLNKQGVTVVRFRNADVFGRLTYLLDMLAEVAEKSDATISAVV